MQFHLQAIPQIQSGSFTSFCWDASQLADA